ncbi:MAG: dienelactone hydrolase family protein [Nitrospirota bacterium]
MGRAGTDKGITTVLVDGGPGIALEGDLAVPERARGIVLFAHGSGSSRRSPRNQFVARVLREAGLGTLLFDLLTPREDAVYETRFNIDLLAQRLAAATEWMTRQPIAASLGVGYFGASTGAAAALIAAADLGPAIGAVVSRGGRPDLAEAALDRVTAPTLLIVGGLDDVVIDLNRQAYAGLRYEKRLVIVPGATHLFEEPGTLEEVARLAADWFLQRLKNR